MKQYIYILNLHQLHCVLYLQFGDQNPCDYFGVRRTSSFAYQSYEGELYVIRNLDYETKSSYQVPLIANVSSQILSTCVMSSQILSNCVINSQILSTCVMSSQILSACVISSQILSTYVISSQILSTCKSICNA